MAESENKQTERKAEAAKAAPEEPKQAKSAASSGSGSSSEQVYERDHAVARAAQLFGQPPYIVAGALGTIRGTGTVTRSQVESAVNQFLSGGRER